MKMLSEHFSEISPLHGDLGSPKKSILPYKQLFERVFRIIPGQMFLYAFSGSKLTLMFNGVIERIFRIIYKFDWSKKIKFYNFNKALKI
jgi:hypothetical protein